MSSSASDGKPSEGKSSEPGPSAGTGQQTATTEGPTNVGASTTTSLFSPAGNSSSPSTSDAPRSTAAALQQLRSRLAAANAASSTQQDAVIGQPAPAQQSAPRAPSQPPHQTQQPVSPPPSAPAQAAATHVAFQGLQLQLGTKDSMLQSMAVLTHNTPKQVEEYAASPLESDQRLLASLRRTADNTQQRAGLIMRMAAGAVPPPAVLVWASQQLISNVRQLVLERLLQPQKPEDGAAAAAGAAALPTLQCEPWYPGAVQLARFALASSTPSPPAPRTDLDLLRSFADPAGTKLPPSPPPASSSAAGEATAPRLPALLFMAWEDLLALPQLPALMDAAAGRSPALETALDLMGLRPAGGGAVVSESRSVAAGPGPSSSFAAGGGGGGAKTAIKASAKPTNEAKRAPAPAVAAAAAAVAGPGPGSGLLAQLRTATAVAREKALREAGLLAADGAVPLDAEALLTALAVGAPLPPGLSLPPGVAAATIRRVAAADWLAAAMALRRTTALLGCADDVSGGGGGVGRETVALLQLLRLPLEPPELSYIDELQVSEKDLRTWLGQTAATLAALPPGHVSAGAAADAAASSSTDGTLDAAAAAAVGLPTPLESRLLAARQRLASGGRALALLAPRHGSGSAVPPGGEGAGPGTGTGSGPAAATAATSAWLRTVGAPLAAGLLAGGYGSLAQLRAMVPELREALVLRLLETGRAGGGVAALTAALYGDAEAAWREARADVAAPATAAALLRGEAVAAAVDLARERFVPPVPELPPPPPLPTDADLATAVAGLPVAVRQLYDSYYALLPERASAAAAVAPRAGEPAKGPMADVLKALEGAGEDAVATARKSELQAWLAEARKGLLSLPPPLLALLLRFLKVQASITPEEAAAQRNKLVVLMTIVAEQQCRATQVSLGDGPAAASADGLDDASSSSSLAAAAQQLSEWAAAGAPADGPGSDARMPRELARVLGAGGARDFASWLQALTLNAGSKASTHAVLAQQSAEMDVERYLTMTHDPRLALPTSGLGGAAPVTSADWRDPSLQRSEAAWLEEMRPQLDAYLKAMGHRRLAEAEWQVYKDAALAEWEAGREEREERVAAAGESGFCNPRADEAYLQEMLERNIPPGDPLGRQSRRYLETIIRNPSWTFVQRRRAVQRLIQLNTYFASQPPAPADGSPFAPLFAVGGPDAVPRLGPLPDGAPALSPGGDVPTAGRRGGGDGREKPVAAVAVTAARRR